jgi:protein disulfide-isomerase A1
MNFSKKTVAALYLAISNILGVSAEDAIAPEDSAVVKLTEATFADFIAENPYVLAEFFAPWCGHCKKLGPEFAAAADTLVESSPDVKLAQIDCTEERDLCSKFEIRGYPTLKVFKGDEVNVSDYPGQRLSDAIVSYMTKLTLPAVQVFDDAKVLDDKINSLAESFILQVIPDGLEKSASNETFYQVADKYKESFTFASTSDKTYVSKYAKSTKKPAYVIFRKGETVDDASIYKGEDIGDDFELLVDFMDVETKPLFGEINGSTYQAYTSAGIPLAYYFYSSQEERDAAEPIIKRIAKKYRGEINFVGLDAVQFGMHAQNLNMKEEFPLFVIHDLKENKKYGIPQEKDLDNNDISQFVQKFKAGKLEPIVKSEAIPETQNSTVYHLVGSEHDTIVNSKKDVFVKYYAPWCGHCKKLAPIFEELSEKYQGKDVIIAELDHTLNDVEGVEIQGYPTLVLFPADGSDPVYYEEARSLEAMANFIKEKGALKIDAFEGESDDDDEEEEKVAVEETAAPIVEEAPEADSHDEL